MCLICNFALVAYILSSDVNLPFDQRAKVQYVISYDTEKECQKALKKTQIENKDPKIKFKCLPVDKD